MHKEVLMRKIIGFILTALILILVGCNVEKTVYVRNLPVPPSGLASITGDWVVYLFWYPVLDDDIESYAIYRNSSGPDHYFELQATISANHSSWIDHDVVNGDTYYYTVSACDRFGYESELSDYTFDTPRPEGFDVTIYDYHSSDYYYFTGYDLFEQERVPYNDNDCDIYLDYDSFYDAFYINVRHDDYYIQDFGYADDFDDVGYAPEYGWSGFLSVEAIEGHMYILKLWHYEQWHYARIWVTDLNADPSSMEFSWAYQVDPENRELKIRPDIVADESVDLRE